MIEVIDNFLTPSYHKELLNFISGDEMQWHYCPNITADTGSDLGHEGFSSLLVDSNHHVPPSPLVSLIMPCLFQIKDHLDSPKILRARLDMTLYHPYCIPHKEHTDMEIPHYSAVYYLNDSDGDTIIGDTKVAPRANRVVVFDGDIVHNGHSPCEHHNRIIINSNYDVR